MIKQESRSFLANLIRPVSRFRGIGRIADLVNRFFLTIGTDPITIASMRDGSKMIVDLRSGTEWFSFYQGYYDQHFISALIKIGQIGGNFLDVDANIGFYSIALGWKFQGTHQKVYAFEPLEPNYNRLISNIRINNLGSTILPQNIGLSDSSRKALIKLGDDFRGGSVTGNATLVEDYHGFADCEVQLEPLDQVYMNIGVEDVGLIKLDIEGHESSFLAGAQLAIEKWRPVIFMEVNKPAYRRQGLECFQACNPFFPNEYRFYRPERNHRNGSLRLRLVSDFQECTEVDNVFAVPAELSQVILSAVQEE